MADMTGDELREVIRAALQSEREELAAVKAAAVQLRAVARRYDGIGTRRTNAIAGRSAKAAALIEEAAALIEEGLTRAGGA